MNKLFHVVVSGSRSLTKPKHRKTIRSILASVDISRPITRLYHGGAMGVDYICGNWAEENNIPVEIIYPDWDRYGRRAGPMRNRTMIDAARLDAWIVGATRFIAFWDGKSRGTKSAIEYAKKVLPESMVMVCRMGEK